MTKRTDIETVRIRGKAVYHKNAAVYVVAGLGVSTGR